MQREYLINNPINTRLIIFFTGWSTDSKVVSNIELPEGYDFLVCWDYRSLNWINLKKEYEETIIIAWSFGVAAADILFNTISENLNVTGLFGINGSTEPIEDKKGIPSEIFKSTKLSLNERNLKKFRIRTAGGIKNFAPAEPFLGTNLSIEDLIEELSCVENLTLTSHQSPVWDCVFISTEDKIFPKENLERAWVSTPKRIIVDSHHLPDFQSIFNLIIKDKKSIGHNFQRQNLNYIDNADVQNLTAERLVKFLKKENRDFKNILEIGSGAGNLTRLLYTAFLPQKLTLIDLSEYNPISYAKKLEGDVECILSSIYNEQYDLIVSGSTLQWVHSPYRTLKRLKEKLEKNGILIISIFIEGTFKEINDINGHSLLYFTKEQWEVIVSKAGFEILSSQLFNDKMEFDSVIEVLKHIRLTGVNSIGGKKKNIVEMKQLISRYPEIDGKIFLTYKSLILLLKKKEDN